MSHRSPRPFRAVCLAAAGTLLACQHVLSPANPEPTPTPTPVPTETPRTSACGVGRGTGDGLEEHCPRQESHFLREVRRDIAQIRRALLQIIIVHCAERDGIFLRDLLEGLFDVDFFRLQNARDFIQQRLVFEHQQMRVENASLMRPHACAYLSLDLQDFLSGLD